LAPHGAHAAPTAEPYVPAAHGAQALSRAEYPKLQVQLVALVLLAGEELYGGHGAHVVLLNLNVPGWQNLQLCVTTSKNFPSLHKQSFCERLPADDWRPTGHATHAPKTSNSSKLKTSLVTTICTYRPIPLQICVCNALAFSVAQIVLSAYDELDPT